MAETVVIVGAGMAGLSTAMALARDGRKIVLVERDPPPPEDGPDAAFEAWSRRGVGQLRHSHAFLARLRILIRDRHPALLRALLDAGCRELTFEHGLTAAHRRTYVPRPVDRDLVILTSRRTTLELVMRRYVEGLPGVRIRSGAFMRELIVEPEATLQVVGVRLEDGTELRADAVVDAAGRTSGALDQLVAAGAPIGQEGEPAGVIYFTRHYRLLDGAGEPPRGRASTTGDLGYLKFGVFPGDSGWFSITLCAPEVEEELRKAVFEPEVFDAVCRQLPGPANWIAADRAQPMSRVFGMGNLDNAWAELAPGGRPAVLGYFPVGDSLVRTNPLYGRGCSFAAVSAELLAAALDAEADPAARLVRYAADVRRELRPYYDVMVQADRGAIRRARQMLAGAKPTLRGRIIRSFLVDGVNIAIRSDPELLRAFLRGFHMLEHPQKWLRNPANLAKVLATWARGKRANAEVYPQIGPDRAELMQAIGLDPAADPERLEAA